MKKVLSIIIIYLLICCNFGVQGIVSEKKSTETMATDIGDVFFNLKMEILMKLSKFPSLSTCVIEGDEVTWSKGYGFYDLENKKPATANTLYNIASITKTITGTALMQLWEQGLFSLDEDVNNYLPFSLRNPNYPNDPITFRMLLSHSSSLNYDRNEYYWLNFSADPPFSFYPYPWLEEFLTPGGKWYYSEIWSSTYRPGEYNMYANVGFDLIGYLVELISGEEFIHYCREHIFIPLEMYDTGWNLSELNIDNVAIPYHYHNGEYLQINDLSYLLGRYTPPDKYWKFRMYPAGGIYTTISDFSHFFIAHMNGGVWNGVRILEEDTIDEMHQIQPPGNVDFSNVHYGLGWAFQDYPIIFNLSLSGHTGGVWGVTTAMYYITYENVGIILFMNGDGQYEQNVTLSAISNSIIPIILLKKGGVNMRLYIDLV